MNWRVKRLFPQCAALLILLFISVAHVHGQTQAVMNARARAEFSRADAELNKCYDEVVKVRGLGDVQRGHDAVAR
jgi:uncharacterized protein YecT (DUF1311 family)